MEKYYYAKLKDPEFYCSYVVFKPDELKREDDSRILTGQGVYLRNSSPVKEKVEKDGFFDAAKFYMIPYDSIIYFSENS